MPLLHCPELELRHSPSSWEPFIPRQASPELDTCIDLLELRERDVKSLSDTGATYRRGLNHRDLVAHLNGTQDDKKPQDPLFRILFVNGHLSRPQDLAVFNDVRPSISSETAEFLHDHLGVSPSFLAVILRKSWELKSGNCQWVRAIPGANGEGSVVEGWYRYSCGLKSFPSYVWYSYTSTCTTYLVNNCEYNGVQDAVVRCVEAGMANSLLRPLAVDGFIAEATSEGWGEAMRLPRLTLIKYESFDEQNMFVDTRESVKELHVLSYNLLIIKEDMTDHIDRLEYLLDVHKTLESTCIAPPPHYGVKLSHSLSFLLSETRIRQRWAECYAQRTGIQINLWYNLSSQRDNKTNLKIADFTSKIATETQKDSSSMITMAAVTMAFLPGTFVSALFSMVFFDTSTSPDGRVSLSVGPNWWLFPVITIPLTILVFAIWHVWRTRRNAQQMQEFMKMEESQRTPEKIVTPGRGRRIRYPESIAPSVPPSLCSQNFLPDPRHGASDWDSQLPHPYQASIALDTYSMARSRAVPAGLSAARPERSELQRDQVQRTTSLDGTLREEAKPAVEETPSPSSPSYPAPWYSPSAPVPTSPYGPAYRAPSNPPWAESPTTSPWDRPFISQPMRGLDTYSMAGGLPDKEEPRGSALPSKALSPLSINPTLFRKRGAPEAEQNYQRFYTAQAPILVDDLFDEKGHRKRGE